METDVRFSLDGSPWRCAAWDVMAADLEGIVESDLGGFAASIINDAAKWRVARRVWGLQPIFSIGVDPDDLKVWKPITLSTKLGMNQAGMRDMLKRIKGAWSTFKRNQTKSAEVAIPVSPSVPPDSAPTSEVSPAPEPDAAPASSQTEPDGIRAAGFSDDMFTECLDHTGAQRRPEVIDEERRWFAGRVQDMKRMLADSMAKMLTRDILFNELNIYRLQSILTKFSPGQKQHAEYLRMLEGLQGRYQDQLKQLDGIAPWARGTEKKIGLRGSISDFVRAHQEWFGRNDNRYVDGMFTATEIQVLMRTPLQAPMCQYPPDIVVATGAAKANLWDPQWNPSAHFKPRDWARLVRAWNAAEEAARDDESVKGQHKTPDLLANDESGEYDDLFSPESQ